MISELFLLILSLITLYKSLGLEIVNIETIKSKIGNDLGINSSLMVKNNIATRNNDEIIKPLKIEIISWIEAYFHIP